MSLLASQTNQIALHEMISKPPEDTREFLPSLSLTLSLSHSLSLSLSLPHLTLAANM